MTKLKILALIFALLALTLAQEATDTGTETETSGSISPSETGVSSEPPIVSGTITEIETSDSETSIDSGSVTESETGETSETSETSIDSGSVTESETSETGETSIDSGSVTESETSETSIDSGSVTESESSETATEETETETSTNTEPEGATDCEDDARMCPDGRSVGRDPNNNCDFFPCPDADTKCDWCIPETQVNETEPATVSVPEDCPLEICGICYVNGAPLGNAANSSCGYGTSRFGGFCACWSGAYGENCTIGDGAQAQAIIPFAWRDIANINYLNLDLDVQENIHFQYNYTGHVCTSFLQVEPLRTVAPPSILSASLVNNSLEIRVSQPMVNGRAETLAYLNAGHDIADCIYPRSDYILKEIEGCNDIFSFTIPWDLSSQCNWMILDEETHTSYCGQVILQHTEWMENICEWRFVQSVLNIKIRLQKYAKVTINTVIVNRPTITAAITNQIVLVNCPEPVLIEITSVINWPYKLDTNFNLSLTPAGKVQNFSLDFDDCTAAEDNTCKQRWRTLLDLTGSACTLDGSYQLSFPQIACASDEDCNLQGEDLQPVVIDYTLTSENFCAVFRIDISLTASIEMFEDAQFNTSRSLFLIGQTAYFLVSARSQANTQENPISFTAIRIRSVTLRGELNNIPVYVVEDGEAQNLTTVSGLTSAEPVEYEQLDRSSLNEVAFSFVMSNDLMTRLLRKNSRSTFIVGVEIEVDYASGERKRGVFSVLSTGTDSATFSVEAAVSNFNSEPLNDSSATGVVMSLLLLAFFALMF